MKDRITLRDGNSYSTEWGVAEIYSTETGELVASLFRDHYTLPCFDWIVDLDAPPGCRRCILLWASTCLDGYDVIDFRSRTLTHVVQNSGEDFIWIVCAVSPDQKQFAAAGCYWACPYQVKIYRIDNPLVLPITEIAACDFNFGKLRWDDNDTFVGFDTIDDGEETSIEHFSLESLIS